MKINYRYSDEEYAERLKKQSLIGQVFFGGAFARWFTDPGLLFRSTCGSS